MLSGTGRQGFTLAELMLATTAMLVVGGAVHRMLQTTQRVTRAQAAQLSLQTGVRGAVLAVTNELRELSTVEGGSGSQNDLLSIAPSEMTYRAMRGAGMTCEPAPPGLLRISRNGFTGHRLPQAGRDSVLVLREQVSNSVPVWVPSGITSVSTAAPCSGTGGPGITLAIPVSELLTGAAIGTPIRVYEIMQLRLYESGGRSWLGMRSVSAGETIQPLFGPLRGHDGFRLDYLDRAGDLTASSSAVKSIRVTVRGESEVAPTDESAGEPAGHLELQTQLVLRNAAP